VSRKRAMASAQWSSTPSQRRPQEFGRYECGAGASEWVEDKRTRIAGHCNDAVEQFQGEFVRLAAFVFLMANWGMSPHTSARFDAAWIHLVFVAAVVVLLAPAVAAGLYGQAVWMEDGGLWAFDEIQERVMDG